MRVNYCILISFYVHYLKSKDARNDSSENFDILNPGIVENIRNVTSAHVQQLIRYILWAQDKRKKRWQGRKTESFFT